MGRAPVWTGVVIGMLAGMLLGAVWLLGRQSVEPVGYRSAAPDTVVVREIQQIGPEAVESGRRNAIVQATEKVAPAVVSINAIDTRVVSRAVVPRGMEFFERFFPDSFPRQQFERDFTSMGSGVIVSADGYVMTNVHVVEGADRIVVTLNDGRQYDALVLETVKNWDLALIQIQGVEGELPFAPIHVAEDPLFIGEWAIAIGSPFGYLLADTQPTVTVGVISALNRDIKNQQRENTFLGMIQTDAAINPGNSGGPLINANGEVIGINTFIFSESGGSIGIGFAVPIERAGWIIRDVREYGRYRRPYSGIGMRMLTELQAQALGVERTYGFIILTVDPGSPADRAGLQPYDVVYSFNGVELRDTDTISRLLYEATVGQKLTFAAERDGAQITGTITLEEGPKR